MSKRGENIYKRKDGRFEARYVKERDINDKIVKYGYVYGKTYTEAKLKKQKAMENINEIRKKEKELALKKFNSSIFAWLNAKISIKETTYYNYYTIIESKINPYFKNIKLRDVKDIHVVNFTRKLMEEGLSNKRIKDILLILKQFFKYEKMDINIIYPKVPKNLIVTFKEEEVQIMEENLLDSNNMREFGIVFVLFTGLRIGELCALQWKDVDLEKQIIRVRKTLARIKSKEKGRLKTKVIIDTPKTETSVRDVPIHDELMPYLRKLKANNNEEYFILTNTNRFVTNNQYYNYYMNILDKLNIEKHKFHTLRHTFATRALLNGVDIKTLSDILGHSSVKITLDRYVHMKKEEKLMQINKLPLLSKRQFINQL